MRKMLQSRPDCALRPFLPELSDTLSSERAGRAGVSGPEPGTVWLTRTTAVSQAQADPVAVRGGRALAHSWHMAGRRGRGGSAEG